MAFKNHVVDDLSAARAPQRGDIVLTRIVLQIHVVFNDHQSSASRTDIVLSVRVKGTPSSDLPSEPIGSLKAILTGN
jgi:hypothetical protein